MKTLNASRCKDTLIRMTSCMVSGIWVWQVDGVWEELRGVKNRANLTEDFIYQFIF